MRGLFKKTVAFGVVLGVVLITAACTKDSEASPYEEKSYVIDAGEVTQISLSTAGRTIELVESSENKIQITYFENDKESYDINITGKNELNMKLVTDKGWKDYVGLDTDKAHRTIQIAVPSGISSGVNLATSKGNIVLSEVNIDGAVEATTSDGNIEITNVVVNDGLALKTKNDDIILSEVTSKGSIDAAISNGNIELTKVAVDDTLKMTTKNGHITGTIIGSYDVFSISSDASKGENNLPENKSSGAKTLDVATNNGDINLEFVEQ